MCVYVYVDLSVGTMIAGCDGNGDKSSKQYSLGHE